MAVRRINSQPFVGAELEDLKFDIKQDGTSTEFVFQEISGIVD